MWTRLQHTGDKREGDHKVGKQQREEMERCKAREGQQPAKQKKNLAKNEKKKITNRYSKSVTTSNRQVKQLEATVQQNKQILSPKTK